MRALKAVAPSGSRRKPESAGSLAGSVAAAARASSVADTSETANSGGAGSCGGRLAQPTSSTRTQASERGSSMSNDVRLRTTSQTLKDEFDVPAEDVRGVHQGVVRHARAYCMLVQAH